MRAPSEQVGNDCFFDRRLRFISTVLQIAAAAFAHIGARWKAPCRVGGNNLPGLAGNVVFFRLLCGYSNNFAGKNVADQDDLPGRQLSQAIAAVDYLGNFDTFQFHLSFRGGQCTITPASAIRRVRCGWAILI
ncbi:MAG: hypothetical protein ACD_75C02285G0002 [uncultured bacterium]|nr:MAG: hypothetical protein ACD_75C02285G0002 [uncultured bacterium]